MSVTTRKSIKLSDGSINYEFEGPYALDAWNPPSAAGLYAIMHLGSSNSYSIDYIGETKDYSTRGFPWEHEKSGCFIREAGSKGSVAIAIHPMPGSTKLQRTSKEAKLVRFYDPSCN